LLDPSRENLCGFEGGFHGFVLWEMKFLELLHSTHFLWDDFDEEIPANKIL
jgi:hypothetical protein